MKVLLGLLLVVGIVSVSANPSFGKSFRGPKSNPRCWTCTMVVKTARTLHLSDLSVDRVLDTVCDHVVSWLKPKCLAAVEDFDGDLRAFSDLSLTPENVCASVCDTTVRSDLMVALVKPSLMLELQPVNAEEPEVDGEEPKVDGEVECSICTLIVGYAESKLESNASIAKITQFLNSTVCGFFPKFLQPECAALIDEYLPEIAQKIEQGYPANVICADIGVCANSSAVQVQKALVKPSLMLALQPAKAMNSEVTSGLGCTICTLIVGYAEDKLGSNASIAKVTEFLNTTVCGLLPKFLQPECAALVDEYLPELAEKISQGYPANVVCSDIGLCSSSQESTEAKAELMKPLVKPSYKKLIQELKSKKVDPLLCSICNLVVGYAEDALQSNSTLASVEAAMNADCAKLPSFLQTGCLGLVTQYGPDLAPYILKHDPPAVVCANVHLCAPSSSAAKKSLFKNLVAPISAMNVRPELMKVMVKPMLLTALVKPQLMHKLEAAKVQPDTAKCDLCEVIIGYLEDKVETNATLAEIETFLNTTVCDFLPSFLQVECAAIVDEYAPEIAQKFQNKETPSQICSQIHLCKNSVKPLSSVRPELMLPLIKTSTFVKMVPVIEQMDLHPELLHALKPAMKSDSGGAVECSICRLIVNAALEYIGNGKTVSEIENWFNSTACTILPKIFQSPCESLVAEYLPQLIAGIENKDNSTVLCDRIQLC